MIFSVSRRSIINNGPARLDKSRYFAQPRPIILNCIHTDGLYIKVFSLSNMIVISHMIVILHGLITEYRSRIHLLSLCQFFGRKHETI